MRAEVLGQLTRLDELAHSAPRAAAHVALTEAAALFEDLMRMHHELLLPARAAIVRFVSFCQSEVAGDDGESLLPLEAVLRGWLPLFDVAGRVAALPLDPPSGWPSGALGAAVAVGGAPDGDGYGLAQPGWLDTDSYVLAARLWLRACEITPGRMHRIQCAALRRQIAAASRLRDRLRSHGACDEFEELLAAARAGAAVAEDHGPLMHAVYVHHLRRVVLGHGESLRARGLLALATDVLQLGLADLEDLTVTPADARTRATVYEAQCRAPLPPTQVTDILPVGLCALSPATRAGLPTLNHPSGPPKAPGVWSGTPAAAGQAVGPLSVLRRQTDLGRVPPGSVVVVPDGGAAWGWAALGAAALLVESGDPLGHAATAAREIGTPCIVGITGLGAASPPGLAVHVDGDQGKVIACPSDQVTATAR